MRGIDNFNFPILNGRYMNEHRGQIHLGLQHLLRVGIWPDSERTVRMDSLRTAARRPTLASPDQHSATVTSDLQFFLCGDNLDPVCGKAKKLETVSG